MIGKTPSTNYRSMILATMALLCCVFLMALPASAAESGHAPSDGAHSSAESTSAEDLVESSAAPRVDAGFDLLGNIEAPAWQTSNEHGCPMTCQECFDSCVSGACMWFCANSYCPCCD